MKKLILIVFVIFLSQTIFATITGNAFLQNQTDHSGIKIKFIPYSPSAQLDSAYTNATGFYSIDISPGIYTIEFSKDDYLTQFYSQGNYMTLTGNEVLSPITLVYLSGNNMAGSISGIWTNDETYYLVDDVYVPFGDSLTIEEGTTIKVFSNCSIDVNGLLKANGTSNNPISITAEDSNPTISEWGEFRFNASADANSYLYYCNIEYGNEIQIIQTNMEISNCTIQYFYKGIYCSQSSLTMKNNTFQQCRVRGIEFWYCTNFEFSENEIFASYLYSDFKCVDIFDSYGNIENNVFHGMTSNSYTYYALHIDNLNEPWLYISNNIMYNFDHGIYCEVNDNIAFVNNVVYGNEEYGIYLGNCPYGATIVQSNCIVNNNYGIEYYGSNPNVEIAYNTFWNNQSTFQSSIIGLGQIIAINANGDPCDPYFNLLMNPHFLDTLNLDFHLFSDSPAIDAGNNDNVISLYDLDGNDRILDGNNDGTAIVDMGVYEVPVEFHPTSEFICPDSICVNEEVEIQYIGNALENSTYFWDFDGGTIVLGTGQGPYQITWDVPGLKVVSLFVQFGENVSDTTYYNIEIIPFLQQASMPVGQTELCQGSQNTIYTTNSIELADDYIWELIPNGAASNITTLDTTVVIDWSQVFSGQVYLKVTGVNFCGEGIESEMLSISILEQIQVFVGIDASFNPACNGETITFTATTINGGEYPYFQWEKNGSFVGTNSPEYVTNELENNDEIMCHLVSSVNCPNYDTVISNLIIMEINDNPEVNIAVTPNDTVCIDQSIILDAGYPGSTYLWSTGDTTQQIEVFNNSGPTGGIQNYFIELIDEYDCYGYDTISVYFDPCTGINTFMGSFNIKVYPNPTNGIIKIELNDFCPIGKLELFSIFGKSIKTELFNATELNNLLSFNLSEFERGIYYLQITCHEINRTIKVIKN